MVIAWFCCRISNLRFLPKLFILNSQRILWQHRTQAIGFIIVINWRSVFFFIFFYGVFYEVHFQRQKTVFVHWKCFNLRDKLWLQRSGCIQRLKSFAMRKKASLTIFFDEVSRSKMQKSNGMLRDSISRQENVSDWRAKFFIEEKIGYFMKYSGLVFRETNFSESWTWMGKTNKNLDDFNGKT